MPLLAPDVAQENTRTGSRGEISDLSEGSEILVADCSFGNLRVFCDNTVGTATLLGKQKALGEQELSPSPESSLEKREEAATGGIWLVLNDTPTPADNDLINRQPCQIRPQIGWLRARSWIRETFV
ncbi:hypothetical protein HGM15179_002555 [Zosterops borbonicus]|uniref:Uncharacterized protein n=1 Tax=Zosterops borbonicus TaxID=364589 RepID=A0A8K1LSJ0_9PASS|nr:hypothetical protein HGM15179_002555 [Zosterops borbonicus]